MGANQYFIAGDKLLAFNTKCGTSSFVNAIIKAHHPDVLYHLENHVHFPYGQTMDDQQQLHRYVPKRVNPDRPAALVVREPVSRFRSAMGFLRLSSVVDEVLDIMINETGMSVCTSTGQVWPSRNRPIAGDVHFKKQYGYVSDDHVAPLKIFRMDQIDECAEWLGLPTPLVRYNETPVAKPDLTPEQIEKVKHYYRKDVELWESL